MKIAITGHNGFLGKAAKKKLVRDCELILFDQSKHDLFDIKSLKSFVKSVDVVIHLAGANRDSESNLIKTNVLGTTVLLEALKQYAPSARIIFASSYQVYYNSGIYGLSKKTAEQIIEEFTKQTDIRGTIFRISNIYGPHGKPFYNSVIATFVHLITHHKPLVINGDGTQKRDYIFVDDVATAIYQEVFRKKTEPFEVFNIGSGKQSSLNEIIKILQSGYGKNMKVVYNESTQKEPVIRVQNIKQTIEKLNWKPQISLQEGLLKTIHEAKH